MKIHWFILGVVLVACTSAVFVPPRHRAHQRNVELLGAKECTWGPSYWCQNLTAAADCHAVKHCIQTVWIHKTLPPDTTSVCQICLDMVKQARDQLQSNETQELIKEVFEGSCALLRIKLIVKECDKIADKFTVELIETLASEMNPQMVCSVAGLCNNDKFIKLQQQDNAAKLATTAVSLKASNCQNCIKLGHILEQRIATLSLDVLRDGLLVVCRKMGSFSDSCSNLVLKYVSDLFNHLKTEFNARDFCLLTGECHIVFHQHDIEITPLSEIGFVNNNNDDLPCDLCKKLIGHLRDVLISNTTEEEFKLVLTGLCKQTKSFKQECLNLVDQYYSEIYGFLVNELNGSVVCELMGLCPKQINEPIMPLMLTEDNVQRSVEIESKQNSELELLPIDLLVPPHTQVLYNQKFCVFCEYLLHYLQQVITDPKSEDEIKHIVDEACEKLPATINSTCVEFVNMYEPALIALLAKEIDPSEICPLIRACPKVDKQHDIEIFMQQTNKDNEKCPLCLFAVMKLEEMVKNQNTEANIRNALTKLCSQLPINLAKECDDFVQTYTDELIEMLIAQLDPQEVCVYLKLCTDKVQLPLLKSHSIGGGDIETNMIYDNTVNGHIHAEAIDQPKDDATCVICEFVMKEIQDELKNNRTEEEIKLIVHNICNHLPGTIKTECNNFVNEYADAIIQLLIATTEPAEICRMIHLCPNKQQIEQLHKEIIDCAICESLVYIIEKILDNPSVDHDVKHVLEKACRALPAHEQDKCVKIIDKYGRTIYELIVHLADKGLVCHQIGMCASKVPRYEQLITN